MIQEFTSLEHSLFDYINPELQGIMFLQTLDLLVVVLQQSKKESEERWKRLSRQITDTLLPALTSNQVLVCQ